MSFSGEPLLIFDGACGSNIQRMNLPNSAWGKYDGCNEFLNISAPEAVVELHTSFLDAGATVIETDSFGSMSIVLSEYGLENEVEKLNHLAVENARKAIAGRKGRYVAGSIGPTTRMPSLGHISFDEMAKSYAEQIKALVESGVDCLIIETCQDILQTKIAVITAAETMEKLGIEVPILVSVTIETTGTMLAGSDISTVAAILEPLPVFSLGLNCATGPEEMRSHIHTLNQKWHGRISTIPNAGMPCVKNGETFYELTPEKFAAFQKRYVTEEGVSIVGGCCGTTPEHIKALSDALTGVTPAERAFKPSPSLASAYQAVELKQIIPPLMIGERCNSNGSKAFREKLLADDFEGCLKIGTKQDNEGAMALDLCVAYAGRTEINDLSKLSEMFAKSIRAPMMIDSTNPECIETALKKHPGRSIINSINLEDGGTNLEKICLLAKKYGATCVALTIDENGMAMTCDEKVAVAKRIHDLAVGKYGLRPSDLIFDCLTFTIGSGDETLFDAAIETINAIKKVNEKLPGVSTTLGVSNISFGLPKHARKILNSVFLNEAVEAGLSTAIVDAIKIVPLTKISEEEREKSLDLIYNRQKDEETSPLMAFISYFENKKDDDNDENEKQSRPEETLASLVINGDKEGLEDTLTILLERRKPGAIINELLVPAMKTVGEAFGKGEMLLPFVLQSAEVMKKGVSFLESFMEKQDEKAGKKILLATVQGDVHDIGKNLVDIILSNNGFQVINIGIKVPAETIIDKAKSHKVDAIGLSGLLVKSAISMKESMSLFQSAGIDVPILLGGAALTPKFVAMECAPDYKSPVVYCKDAFAGLKTMREIEEGTVKSTVFAGATKKKTEAAANIVSEIKRGGQTPAPPFYGRKIIDNIETENLFKYINKESLFRGRWGYRKGKTSEEDYQELVKTKVTPIFEELKKLSLEGKIIKPEVAYGYYKCHSEGNNLVVDSENGTEVFPFPRQSSDPHLCISDYFKTEKEGGDTVGFFIATMGDKATKETHKLFSNDEFHDYLIMHGFSVEITDALAEYWHEIMRGELGIDNRKPDGVSGYITQEYQGSRYGFGYPSCPDLDAHVPLFKLLKPEDIGVSLTENMQMTPEQTTSAIVVHHPDAKYFTI